MWCLIRSVSFKVVISIALCSTIEQAIIRDYPVSKPLMPAYILIELVQNTANIII